MPVFISHRTADDAIAAGVANYLQTKHSITCYRDDIDRELASKRGQAALTPVLVDRLRKCTNLLAVVTPNTEGSWWVPFEIGTAREMPRIISSYTNLEESKLPEYLLEWPRLRSHTALDQFAETYKGQKIGLTESRTIKAALSATTNPYEIARNFESKLMTTLSQRNFR